MPQLIHMKSTTFVFSLQGGDWGDGGALLFEPHTGPVSCMAFSRAQPTQLLSLSYDGSLRCMEVEKAVFHDVRWLLFLKMY